MRSIALALGFLVLAGAAEIPRAAGEIAITLPDNSKIDVATYHGKVVCLAFILTT